MKKAAVLLLLVTLTCFAQEEIVRRVFQLKYAEPQRVRLFLLGSERLTFDDQLKTIAVEATRTKMTEYEEIIKRFDVPAPPIPNIEVTIYIMSALTQPSTASPPAELESVIKQLKGMFSYKGYQVIDIQVIRTRAGQGGESSGVVENGSPLKTVSQAKFNSISITNDEKGRALRINNLKVGLKIPIPRAGKDYQYLDTGISTDVDVREGQKVVVGKANMDGSDRASIVVLTAKVVD